MFGKRGASWFPNGLTIFRLLAVPVMVACMYWQTDTMRWVALGVFVLAALSDLLDGLLARRWRVSSAFGRMLDPIADKLLVTSTMVMLVFQGTIGPWSVPFAIIILSREILVSGLREFLAQLRVPLPVTMLSKWKTTLQMTSLAVLVIGPAAEHLVFGLTSIGLFLLWMAAALTLYTGWDYFIAGFSSGWEEMRSRSSSRPIPSAHANTVGRVENVLPLGGRGERATNERATK